MGNFKHELQNLEKLMNELQSTHVEKILLRSEVRMLE